jgi:hypothetical protein
VIVSDFQESPDDLPQVVIQGAEPNNSLYISQYNPNTQYNPNNPQYNPQYNSNPTNNHENPKSNHEPEPNENPKTKSPKKRKAGDPYTLIIVIQDVESNGAAQITCATFAETNDKQLEVTFPKQLLIVSHRL